MSIHIFIKITCFTIVTKYKGNKMKIDINNMPLGKFPEFAELNKGHMEGKGNGRIDWVVDTEFQDFLNDQAFSGVL